MAAVCGGKLRKYHNLLQLTGKNLNLYIMKKVFGIGESIGDIRFVI